MTFTLLGQRLKEIKWRPDKLFDIDVLTMSKRHFHDVNCPIIACPVAMVASALPTPSGINESQLQAKHFTSPPALAATRTSISKMSKGSVLLFTICFIVLCWCQAHGYEGSGALPEFSVCQPQSPIEFDVFNLTYREYSGSGLRTNYSSARAQAVIEEEGPRPQVNFLEQAGTFFVQGRNYALKQFHFHRPTEHKFKQYPEVCDTLSLRKSPTIQPTDPFVLEMHLVHETPDNRTAVIGLLFQLGDTNEFLQQIWPSIRRARETGNPVDLPRRINLSDLDLSDVFIQYNGSLTSPPYTPGVYWTVPCANWQTISLLQFLDYETLFPRPNSRPVQPACGDAVLNFPRRAASEAELEQEGPSLVQSS